MGKRDSKAAKAKRNERRTETRQHAEEKSGKSEAKKEKRSANKKDDEDIDALLAEFKSMQTATKTVKEEVVPPPSPRVNCSVTMHPTRDELLLFGGELNDGKKNIFNADLYRYSIKRNEWKHVMTPSSPPPRSSHQAVVVPSSGGSLFVFGGEFSSPNQTTFHHYRDFWCLDLTTWLWEPVQAKNGPSARSGHRMVHVRDHLMVFGGFFDNLRDVKYYNDLYLFDLSLYKWTKVTPEPGAPVPSPRSGFQMVTDPTGGADGNGCVILYGGYFKKKVAMQLFDSHKDKSQVGGRARSPTLPTLPLLSLCPHPQPRPGPDWTCTAGGGAERHGDRVSRPVELRRGHARLGHAQKVWHAAVVSVRLLHGATQEAADSLWWGARRGHGRWRRLGLRVLQ